MVKPIPPNPNQISAIQINYDKGADGFHIVFYKGNDRVETTETLYVGDLANTIVQKMGVSGNAICKTNAKLRKLFAKRVKRGDFKKAIAKTKKVKSKKS